MFSLSVFKKVKAIALASGVAVVLCSIPSFSAGEGELGIYSYSCYRTSPTDVQSSIYGGWYTNPSDPTLPNGAPYKHLRVYASSPINSTDENVQCWIGITSNNSSYVDTKLWYLGPTGYEYLSDDEGGNANFKAVIHWPKTSSRLEDLAFSHYYTDDLATYHYTIEYFSADPMWTGCYYLEMGPGVTGSGTLVQH